MARGGRWVTLAGPVGVAALVVLALVTVGPWTRAAESRSGDPVRPAAVLHAPGAAPGAPAPPGTGAPRPGIPLAGPVSPVAPAVGAVCATSWGVGPSVPLSVPRAVGDPNLCGAGAVRPHTVQAGCTRQATAATLQAAAAAARPGDRICVHGGTAPGRLTITRSGTPQAPVSVLGDGTATVRGLTVTADNVVVSGLNLDHPPAPGVELTGNGLTLVNTVITAPRGDDGDGIRFFGSNIKILHNTVSDVRNLGGAHADCMQTFTSDNPNIDHVVIDSNRCEAIDNQCLIAEGPNSSAGDGSRKGRSEDLTFTHNVCDAHASQAVWIDDVQRVSITYNVLTGKNEKAFGFDNKATGARVIGNVLGSGIGFAVGMDTTSKAGYSGPSIGGQP